MPPPVAANSFCSVLSPPPQVRSVAEDPERLFALKRLRKDHVVQKHQQNHVLMEKRVLQQSRCPFIVRWAHRSAGVQCVCVCVLGEVLGVPLPPSLCKPPAATVEELLQGLGREVAPAWE